VVAVSSRKNRSRLAARTVRETAAQKTGQRSEMTKARQLTAVLFVDIVEATPLALSLGDRAWAELLEH